ncbi:MAG: DegT/DnrJ/EryC1/StrS family aminotransferase [Chitinophagaceae bacterium]|nr:DegT/DnrJ/EryC1/StrS family aminotransferase [Chitinophagaceae bacterium]MCA6459662.1 DegT/DnrJ/EryC1/StrS family aminotransferase [Chitinophagaceae bacterium]MCA6464529.1 DegT/DnrJ/EryC1/StrS family aminotransferase [Chitinophagaceae bacterium]
MHRLSKSVVGHKEVDAVTDVLLKDGYLGMGAEVARFEADIANYIGVSADQVVCVNSGTAALHLAVEAILSKEKYEVIVPSFTFLSSYQAISAAGAVPVSCDVYDNTWTLDLEMAKELISERTCAIMAVHYASNPVNLNKLYELAAQHNIRVIEDAAHAFGCVHNGKKIGSVGDIVCFSFDGIKNITSGEGGAILSRDSEFLSIVKDTRLLGVEKDTEKRIAGQRSWDFDVKRQGYRYHMSNIFAAIGRVQLSRLDSEFAPKRKSLLSIYTTLLAGNENIILQKIEEGNDIIPHIFPVRVKNGKRDSLRAHLESKSIQTGIHYKPNHLLSLYKNDDNRFINTLNIYKEIVTLPLHPDLTEGDVKNICKEIINYLEK